jgi:excisionase family DNA binding protein
MSEGIIEPLLLNPRQAAAALNICERTLFELTKAGQLPTIRIGRAVRYDRVDLQRWIDETKQVSEKS